MRYKTVIFDLDGTLLDTLDDLAAATNYALAQHGMPQHTRENIRWFVGNGAAKLIERCFPAGTPKAQQDEVLATFAAYYKLHNNDKTAAYPGVMQLLDDLRAAGCQTAIVSNKPGFAVQDLTKLYFDGRMDAACGENEAAGIAKKPAPDMVLAVMKKLGADPTSTVYVGDSDTDLETAANSGLPCIGACWGFRGRDFLAQHGCTMLAEGAQDVLEFCK